MHILKFMTPFQNQDQGCQALRMKRFFLDLGIFYFMELIELINSTVLKSSQFSVFIV